MFTLGSAQLLLRLTHRRRTRSRRIPARMCKRLKDTQCLYDPAIVTVWCAITTSEVEQRKVQDMEAAKAYYEELGTQSDLREPHRIPQGFMQGLFEKEVPTLPPAPVIAFINSRSGGHAGPALSQALRRALGSTQVRCLASFLLSGVPHLGS